MAALLKPRVLLGRRIFASIFLAGAVAHVALLIAGVNYGSFASAAYFGFVRHLWINVVATHTYIFIPLLVVFEASTGLLLLSRGHRAVYGIVAAIGFHVGLMFFSFGIWMWSIPMLALLVWLLRETLASSDISVADVERGHDAEERAQTPAA